MTACSTVNSPLAGLRKYQFNFDHRRSLNQKRTVLGNLHLRAETRRTERISFIEIEVDPSSDTHIVGVMKPPGGLIELKTEFFLTLHPFPPGESNQKTDLIKRLAGSVCVLVIVTRRRSVQTVHA